MYVRSTDVSYNCARTQEYFVRVCVMSYVSLCMCVNVFVCYVCVSVDMCVSVCLYVYVYVRVYVCTYVRIFVCMLHTWSLYCLEGSMSFVFQGSHLSR